LFGGNRQAENLAGVQAVGRAFEDAIHQQAGPGPPAKTIRGTGSGGLARLPARRANSSRGGVFRHHQIVPRAIQNGGQIVRSLGGRMACVETHARQFAHALFRDFSLGFKE
jgi:hypothetical protein